MYTCKNALESSCRVSLSDPLSSLVLRASTPPTQMPPKRTVPKLPEYLLQVARSARPLRQWSRDHIVSEVERSLAHRGQRFTQGEFDRRRQARLRLLEKSRAEHSQLDAYFQSLGLSLPADHPMVRHWGHMDDRLSQLTQRERRNNATTAKDKDESKTEGKDEKQGKKESRQKSANKKLKAK